MQELLNQLFNRVLMEGIKEQVFIVKVGDNSEFYYEFLNQTAMERTGFSEEIIGKSINEVYPKERADFLNEQYRLAISQTESIKYEDSYNSLLGEKYFSETTLTPLLDKDTHQCTHVIALVHDITEKKWGEFELREYWKKVNESNQKYSSLYKNNSDAIITFNIDGEIIEGNDKVEALTGYSMDEIAYSDLSALFDRKNVELLEENFKKAIEGEPLDFSLIMNKKTGEQIELVVKFTPIIVNNQVVGIFSMMKDITNLIHITRKYMDTKQRLKIITEKSQDLITILNIHGFIVDASPSHKHLLGYEQEELIGKHFTYNIHPDDKSLLEETILHAIQKDNFGRIHIRKKHAVNGWMWFDLKATPVFNEENEFVYMVCVSSDIQSQMDYESELQHLAFHDSMTNLPNRRYLKEFLKKSVDDYVNDKINGLVVGMMDLDHFKSINDEMGHDAGDAVIIEFGNRIRKNLRNIDFIARLGGDEFVIVLPDIQGEDIGDIVENIQKAIHEPWSIGDKTCHLTTSIGIGIVSKDETSISSILKTADLALYEAKEAGRDTYKIWDRGTGSLSQNDKT
ncbi:diguanylate cyclase [Bacillus timonensis]|uniref:Diguanylate cyclase n=1 Tax=Bacillus timonensis TaxID=1033734 RepID=A0A4S3PK37_9BACI|nr:sensor domain-containing diguanylate cyclase [Bacillus timonensis]THE09749.1 diguanylate cyclase [Bacillus timonensis]